MAPQCPSAAPRFSLAALFAVVTLSAIACGLIARFGVWGAIGAAGLGVIPVGRLSIRAGREGPFWQGVASVLVPLVFAPLVLPSTLANDASIMVLAVAFGIGTSLSLSAVLRGHWSTRLLAGLPLVAYLFFLFLVIRDANWETVIEYWRW